MFVFRHPKYYEELRKERKKLGEKAMKDEATSDKQQATSDKRQAGSIKRQAPEQDSD
jgi:hypothetical protein